MKPIRILGLVALSLVLASPALGWGGRDQQRDRQDKGRPQEKQRGSDKQAGSDSQRGKPRGGGERAQPRERGQSDRPQPSQRRGDEQRPASRAEQPRRPQGDRAVRAMPPEKRYPSERRTEQQARVWQEQRGWRHGDAWQEHPSWRLHRANHWEREHRTWVQRGGYGGYYIPEDRFYVYFGVAHYFRIRTRPVVVMGYPRFHYHGYWFMLVDPWPEFWADRWYETDDVYIDYDDGYYLYNRRHPGVAIAVSVVF